MIIMFASFSIFLILQNESTAGADTSVEVPKLHNLAHID